MMQDKIGEFRSWLWRQIRWYFYVGSLFFLTAFLAAMWLHAVDHFTILFLDSVDCELFEAKEVE